MPPSSDSAHIKALFIMDEPQVFEEGSPIRESMRELAQAIGTLVVLSPCLQTYHGPLTVQEGELYLCAVPRSKFFFFSSLTRRAHSLIQEHAIDIVSAPNPFEYGMAALKAIRGTNAKLHVYIPTEFLSPWFVRSHILRSPQTRVSPLNKTRQQLAEQVLPRADGIRVPSKRVYDSVVTHYGTRIQTPVLVPPAISSTLPPKIELPEHTFTFVLMVIGRLTSEKRIEDILVALNRIKDSYPSVGLMIIGDGPERANLEHWASALGLSSRVMFLGDRPDALGLLQNANTYIQANAYQGYGRILVQAALADVPIITSDVGIVGEVFRGYDELLATPPGDPTNLSYHIIALLEDISARQQYSMKARQAAEQHLATVHTGPHAIAGELLDILQNQKTTPV